MPRGRQYYDPIVQASGIVEGDRGLARIELYPEVIPRTRTAKWRGRQVTADGSIDRGHAWRLRP